MKSKILLSIIVLIALTASLFAKNISISTAEKVAVNFFFEKSAQYGEPINYYDLNIKESYLIDQAYYVVNFEDGWIMVAADDVMVPVLGYNYTGSFPAVSEQEENFRNYIQNYVDQAQYVKDNNLTADNETMMLWKQFLTNDPTTLNLRGSRAVEPLLTSTWNQDNPYNMMCPEDPAGPGGHVYVGCVATAMSMIMHYWRYPLQGSGQHSYYEYPYGTQFVDYEATTYNWDGMQDAINNKYIWEIAKIGYHAAVSVDMGFAPDGSGAYSIDVPEALISHFGYSPLTQYLQKSSFSTPAWNSIVKGEIDAGRPIYYSGQSTEGGHAFGCDGYQDDTYFHFNFGWSGSGNGYYTLSDVNGYSYQQGLVRNFFPADPNYPYVASGLKELTAIAGSFTDGSGPIEDYPSGMDAQWLIKPQTEQDSVTNIDLHFVQFNTAASDVVRFYDGNSTSAPLLGEYSGNSIPDNLTSTGNEVLITFTTTGTSEGFKIEYTSILPAYCSGTQVIAEETGTITDGSGSFFYNNLATCIYMIQHPEGVRYHLDFNEFDTEAVKDKLTIYDGNSQLIGEYSGNTLPDAIDIETDMIFMTWGTNAYINNPGWSITYSIDGVGVDEKSVFDDLSIYPNPTTGQLRLSFGAEKVGKLQIRLTNISGQVVVNEQLGAFNGHYSNTFDLSDQAKGVYLLSIISEKGKTDRKIVLQ
ncbi:MAG: C10 family peptidase [Bacteroidales bacterium]|jgi:hypothetical protein